MATDASAYYSMLVVVYGSVRVGFCYYIKFKWIICKIERERERERVNPSFLLVVGLENRPWWYVWLLYTSSPPIGGGSLSFLHGDQCRDPRNIRRRNLERIQNYYSWNRFCNDVRDGTNTYDAFDPGEITCLICPTRRSTPSSVDLSRTGYDNVLQHALYPTRQCDSSRKNVVVLLLRRQW